MVPLPRKRYSLPASNILFLSRTYSRAKMAAYCDHCEGAATLFQALWRGYVDRHRLEAMQLYRLRKFRIDRALTIQSLWRGYKTRKELKERNAEEVSAVTPLWRTYDDKYRMYVFCQSLMAELKKDDATWDATKTPYYIWMMEKGPFLEECETYMLRRGWVRPKKEHLDTVASKGLIQGVLESSGVPQAHWKTTLALYNTFVKTR